MKKIIFYILIIFILIPGLSKAQDTYPLLEPLPCIEGTSNECEGGVVNKVNLNTYIEYIFKFSIALAAFLAVIMIIWGGIEYMGSEVPFIKSNGRKRIEGAVGGLVMVLASYLILRTIDPRLVEINTSIPKIEIKKADLESVADFQAQLSNDLKNLSYEKQLEVNEATSKINNLEKERTDLMAKYQRGEISELEYEVTMESINQDITSLRTQRSNIVVQDVGLVNFQRALDIINDYNNYTSDAEVSSGIGRNYRNWIISDAELSEDVKNNLKEASETIKARYNEQMQSIGNTDPELAQLLGKQRDFFIDEIRIQQDVAKNSLLYKKADGNLNGNHAPLRRTLKPYLEGIIKYAKEELENPQKGRDLKLENEYKTMLQQRLIMAENALK